MKKNVSIVIGVIVILIVVIGGYAVLSQTAKKASQTNRPINNSSVKKNTVAINNSIVKTMFNSKLGSYLTDPKGNALYIYNADKSGVSNCYGSCAAIWPAYQDKGSTTGLPKGFATIKRKDNNEIQYTFNGKPLYYFSGDKKGQVNGNGVAGFYVARP